MNHIAIIYLWNLTFTVQAVLKRKILLKYRNTNLISRKSIFRKGHLLFSRLKCQFLRQNQPLKDSRIMTNPRNVLKTIVKQEFFANFQLFLFLQFLTINSVMTSLQIFSSNFPPFLKKKKFSFHIIHVVMSVHLHDQTYFSSVNASTSTKVT